MDINWGKTLLWTTGIAGLGYGGWLAYNYYNMSKGGLQIGTPKINIHDGIIQVDLPVSNITAAPITLTGLTAGFYVIGNKIIDITENQVVTIAAHSTHPIALFLRPNWVNLGLFALSNGVDVVNQLKTGNLSGLDAKIEGNVFVSNLRIPFNKIFA
ncbi:MAG: hypothetical protein RLZZ628_2887 [Bacteroidota bacterium]|jgi:hypothetical protein